MITFPALSSTNVCRKIKQLFRTQKHHDSFRNACLLLQIQTQKCLEMSSWPFCFKNAFEHFTGFTAAAYVTLIATQQDSMLPHQGKHYTDPLVSL